MLCSYYWLRAYRIDSTLIDEQKVFSFQEAYSFIDCWRDDYPDAYSFRLSYPTEEWFPEQERIAAKKEEEAAKEAEAKKAAEESVAAESPAPDAKPKRHRRTKAEMAAARAAEAAGESKKVRKK